MVTAASSSLRSTTSEAVRSRSCFLGRAEQLQQCIRLGVRTMMMTREQIREWEGHPIEMIFAADDEY